MSKIRLLTRRELDVIRLMSQGFSNHGIAAKLYLNIGTIKGYIRRIYGKLGVNTDGYREPRMLAIKEYIESGADDFEDY
jgi:DNA-binding NarL/FixJ family response regulator